MPRNSGSENANGTSPALGEIGITQLNSMTAKWSHLPNAHHIDRVLAHLEQHPKQWQAAWCSVENDSQRNDRYAAEDAALLIIENAGRGPERRDAWTAAHRAAARRSPALAGEYGFVGGANVRDTLLALVAWDTSSSLLSLPIDQVEMLAALGHHPAVLLLTSVRVMSTETA